MAELVAWPMDLSICPVHITLLFLSIFSGVGFRCLALTGGDLVINVGYGSMEEISPTSTYRQIISGNSSTDTVTIEYSEPDGMLITQLTDFRMQSQIMRVIIPGEEELGQTLFQVVCFVSFFAGDLIPPEAVMKLRQKHPKAVRTAEDDQGNTVQDCPLSITVSAPSKLSKISSHLSSMCKDARSTSYTSQQDLQNILNDAAGQVDHGAAGMKTSSNTIDMLSKKVENYESLPVCSALSSNNNKNNDDNNNHLNNNVDDEQDEDTANLSETLKEDSQCLCTRKVWLNWYPCALKYCKNKDGEGEHRCGIKTCRKSITFHWATPSQSCILNDDDDEM